AANLMQSVGISTTYYILGAGYFVLMFLGASYITPPPANYMPEGMKQAIDTGKKEVKKDLRQLTAKEAVKTKHFWMLWTMKLINTSAGIMMISVASPMAQDVVGLSVAGAATLVGIMGIFNGGGRLGWAAASDYLGRHNVFIIFFVIQLVAFIALPVTTNTLLFQALILLVVSCYGGGFSNLPAFAGDLFGTKEVGAIHGYLLTTWSLGGVCGPMLVTAINGATGSYIPVFYVFFGLIALTFIISVWLRADVKKMQRAEQQGQNEALRNIL
ncbi:MFS transporter, partial [Peribacillus asahii]